MIKYIKWLFLIILIVCLGIVGIKFLNYDKFKIEDIFEQTWLRKGFDLYNANGKLIASNYFVINDYYIIFSNDKISYCNTSDDKCNNYSYKYKKGKITINGDDEFIYNGTYSLKYEDHILKLSMIEDGNKTTYYFIHFLG